jgi:hypothetical protein
MEFAPQSRIPDSSKRLIRRVLARTIGNTLHFFSSSTHVSLTSSSQTKKPSVIAV